MTSAWTTSPLSRKRRYGVGWWAKVHAQAHFSITPSFMPTLGQIHQDVATAFTVTPSFGVAVRSRSKGQAVFAVSPTFVPSVTKTEQHANVSFAITPTFGISAREHYKQTVSFTVTPSFLPSKFEHYKRTAAFTVTPSFAPGAREHYKSTVAFTITPSFSPAMIWTEQRRAVGFSITPSFTASAVAHGLAKVSTVNGLTTTPALWTISGGGLVGSGSAARAYIQPTGTVGASVYGSIASANHYDATESSVYAELVLPPSNPASNVNFIVYNPVVAHQAGFRTYGDNNMQMYEYNGTTYDYTSLTFDFWTMRLQRIRFSGTAIYWDTSFDGTTWTNRRTKTVSTNPTSEYGDIVVIMDHTGTMDAGFSIWNNVNTVPVFTPFGEWNTNRTNQAWPTGAAAVSAAWMRGAGAGGGAGYIASFSNCGGGGGGGGGGYVKSGPWDWIVNMGANYSVVRPTAPAQQVNGAAATFSSGTHTVTANGGTKGNNGANNTGGTGGAGGTVTSANVPVLESANGAAGGAGHPSGAGAGAGGAATATNAGPGGGGGAGMPSSGATISGAAGGSSRTVTGPAGTTTTGTAGGAGAQGQAGAGGAGAGVLSNAAKNGGAGGNTGAGGGGGSGGTGGGTSAGGAGSNGETYVEFR